MTQFGRLGIEGQEKSVNLLGTLHKVVDIEDRTHSEGLMRVLAGVLRNMPDNKIRISESDAQRLDNEQVLVTMVQTKTGSFIELELLKR